MNGGALVVRALRTHGVEIVFGIPGTHNLEIYRALHGSGIRHVTPRHEQGAGYAADGYARVSGKPGVAIVTTGPALMNIAAAIGQAYSDSVPLLVISPGMPLGHPAGGNGTLHETKNQSGALDNVAAYSHRVTSLAEIPLAVSRAFATFANGRPRPVHIEIPYDLLSVSGAGPAPTAPRSTPMAPDLDTVRDAAAALAGAANPAFVAGGGAKRASAPLLELASRLGAPVFTTTNGKGIIREDHPLAATSALHLASVRDHLEACDVVLAVGTELAPTDFWLGVPRFSGRLIRVDIDPDQINVNATPDVAIVADAGLTLRALLDIVPRDEPHPAPDLTAIKSEARTEGARWLPWLDAIAGVLDDTAIVAADNAMAGYYGALGNLAVQRPSGFLFPTGYGTLGFAVPAGIGAALGDPQATVVALSGDGGLMFSVQELATAASERITLPVVVFNNHGYGEIRAEMADGGITPLGVDLPSPDFVALAIALGGRGVAIDTPAQLGVALAEALKFPGPTLLVVPEPLPTKDA
jgi:acetolactate synthase I/II/III large subunit